MGLARWVGIALLAPALSFAATQIDGGLLQGTVSRVNLEAGTLTLISGQERAVVRGTPAQLQEYRKGEFTSIPIATYAGSRWLASHPGPLQPQRSAPAVTVTGVVKQVNMPSGTLTLNRNGKTLIYSAHPEKLQSVLPGDLVSITYAQVGSVDWIQQVQPAQPRNTGGSGEAGGAQ